MVRAAEGHGWWSAIPIFQTVVVRGVLIKGVYVVRGRGREEGGGERELGLGEPDTPAVWTVGRCRLRCPSRRSQILAGATNPSQRSPLWKWGVGLVARSGQKLEDGLGASRVKGPHLGESLGSISGECVSSDQHSHQVVVCLH